MFRGWGAVTTSFESDRLNGQYHKPEESLEGIEVAIAVK